MVLVLFAGLPANAHQTDPNVFTRIDSITPQVPGLTIQIRAGVADQLFVVNNSGFSVEVLDSRGKPFLRIGGPVVEADLSSPDWHTSVFPLGVPAPSPAAASTWTTIAYGNSWGWFDHRLHDRERTPPPGARGVTRLGDWTIPMRRGLTDITVKGHVEYRPVVGAFRTQVEKVPPNVALDVLDGRVPGLFLRWQGTGTLTVKDINGLPFARFTGQSVEVNAVSETWLDDQRLRGKPPPAMPWKANPDWEPQGANPQLTWLDRRLAYSPGVPPNDALRSTRPTTVVEWDIPVDVNGVPGRLQGTTTWVPNAARAATDTRPWLPVALVAVVVVVAAVVLRRRAER